MPIGNNPKAIPDILHGYFCQIGTATMALSVGLMVVAYCRETKTSVNNKAMIIAPAFAVITLGTLGLFTTGRPGVLVAAMFSLMATFMIMVFTHYLTVCFELAPKKETIPASLFRHIRRGNGKQ